MTRDRLAKIVAGVIKLAKLSKSILIEKAPWSMGERIGTHWQHTTVEQIILEIVCEEFRTIQNLTPIPTLTKLGEGYSPSMVQHIRLHRSNTINTITQDLDEKIVTEDTTVGEYLQILKESMR